MTSKFSELGLSEDLVKAIEDIGWTEPTPIQTEAIPYGLDGYDLLAQAQTGTGKTAAYGSIILDGTDAEGGWAKALILTPTRELALQVTEELERLAKYTGHKCVSIYGGVSMLKQTQALDKGVDIIVATPGRLIDHLKDEERLLGDVSVIVLDEADRMLDMGFRRDLEFILGSAPEDRQTMLFSATMADNVRDLALKHLYEPKEVCVSKDEPVLDLISQRCMFVDKDDKIDMLRYVLAKDPIKTMVFCFTKYRVDKVVRKLKMSFRLAGIHGDVPQNRREEILRKFREGKIDVLVASDLAARGLDIDNVGRIINLDMPPEPETYVHRIGRTGRAGKEGIAISFVMPEEKRLLRDIENTTLIPLERIEPPTEEEMEDVFSNIKELSRPVISKKNSRKNDVPVSEKEYVLAEMNIGKEDGQNKASISQLLRDYTDVPKKSIGNIRLEEKTSVLEVEKKYLKNASVGISNCAINGKTVRLWPIADVETPIQENVEPVESKQDRRPRYSSEERHHDSDGRREHRHDDRCQERSQHDDRRRSDSRRSHDDRGYRSRSDEGDRRQRYNGGAVRSEDRGDRYNGEDRRPYSGNRSSDDRGHRDRGYGGRGGDRSERRSYSGSGHRSYSDRNRSSDDRRRRDEGYKDRSERSSYGGRKSYSGNRSSDDRSRHESGYRSERRPYGNDRRRSYDPDSRYQSDSKGGRRSFSNRGRTSRYSDKN